MKKRFKTAFTLAEVLITLGIIGVVAAITIAPVIRKYKEQSYIRSLEKIYSTLYNAFNMAIQENGSATTWGVDNSFEGSSIIAKYMMPYLKVKDDCGTMATTRRTSKCYIIDRYSDFSGEILNNGSTFGSTSYYISLNDGMVINFNGQDGTTALFPNGYINVDINGKKGPNRWGVDYFSFWIYDSKLYPTGEKTPSRNAYGWGYCKNKQQNVYAYGFACTAWALQNKNMDYIRCRESLNWDTKKTCK